jgi:uncharacterized protein with von Willebrand factor type A (vWA) domain
MSFTQEDLDEVNRAIVELATVGKKVQWKDRSFERADLRELREIRDMIRSELGAVARRRRVGRFERDL